MFDPAELVIKAALHAVKKVVEKSPEEIERERREEQERQRQLDLRKQKLAEALPNARAIGLDVAQINRELEKIDVDLKNIDVVIERIRRIVDRPGNELLKEHFAEEMDALSKKGAKRGAGDGQVSETSEEMRTRTMDSAKALDSLKGKVGELMGKSFFTRKTLEHHEERISEIVEQDGIALNKTRMPPQTMAQLNEVRRAIVDMQDSDGKLKQVQNLSAKTQEEQRHVEKEEATV